MRNDVAWMVYDDHHRRVVMLRLGKAAAATLARTLNVADLEAPVLDETSDRPVAKKTEAKKKAEAKKP